MKDQPHRRDPEGLRAEAASRRGAALEPILADWRLGRRRMLPWILGLLTLSALLAAVLLFSSIERFVELARGARPEWLILALIAQTGTYACAAAVWRQALRRAGHRPSFGSLYPLGVAKLFMDQAIPSGGASGTVLVVKGLTRRRVPLHFAMAAMLVGLVSYDAAYLIAVLGSVAILWLHGRASLAPVAAVGIFAAVVVTIPAAVLFLRRWINHRPMAWLRKLPGMDALLTALAEAPTDLLRNTGLLVEAIALQLGIFLLDALTLWLAFHAFGMAPAFWIVLVSFVIASMTATLAPIPLGLGTFEGGSVGMLSLLGVPIEAALAGTLLFRGLAFWLPMLPGLWLAKREIGGS